jgi:hypothetical protein
VRFVYVAVIFNAWSLRVVGDAISRRIYARLILAALQARLKHGGHRRDVSITPIAELQHEYAFYRNARSTIQASGHAATVFVYRER